jgi:YD repeat-containing protein
MFFSFLFLYGYANVTGEEHPVSNFEENGIITFTNNTPFRVNIEIGSMRTAVKPIEPWEKNFSIPNRYSQTEIYYLYYDIPLLPAEKGYDLLNVSPLGGNSYLQIDNTIKNQHIIINRPAAFDIDYCYLVFTNKGNKGGIYLSENQSSRLNSIHEHSKDNINQDETEVFLIRPALDKTLYVTGPANVTFPVINYKAAYVYSFTYEDSGVTLTDARPLHRIGEPSWSETVNEAVWKMPLVTDGDKINLFSSAEKNITRYEYDSAGNLTGQVNNGDAFTINAAAQTGDGFLIAGQKTINNITRPVARIHNADGTIKHIFEPSNQYPAARFFTVSRQDKNDVWLLAGDGRKTGSSDNLAYARLVQNQGGKFSTLWETGGNDFSDGNSGIKCGNIESAAYDTDRACWLVTGETVENGVVTGAYIAEIDSSGKNIKIDPSFKGMSFYKILVNSDGVCFLAGEEYRGNLIYAVLIKYNLINGQYQRISAQIAPNSYYYDAVLDNANKQLTLAGVKQAKDGTGQGGVPFIEAVNIENGALLWHENLSVEGASLVTSITPAPHYGFALTLSNIDKDGFFSKPFKIIRVNSQGKI